MKFLLSGLLHKDGMAIRVVSLMNEMLDPVSNMMCMSVPSTMPLMCAVQVSVWSVAEQRSLSGRLVSVVVICMVSTGAGGETADVCPASSASGSFPDDVHGDLCKCPVDHSEDPCWAPEVSDDGLCSPQR